MLHVADHLPKAFASIAEGLSAIWAMSSEDFGKFEVIVKVRTFSALLVSSTADSASHHSARPCRQKESPRLPFSTDILPIHCTPTLLAARRFVILLSIISSPLYRVRFGFTVAKYKSEWTP